MIIGIPKEIKEEEYRVAIVPSGVRDLVASGHTVLVEKDAGIGSGISNSDFKKEGAKIISNNKKIFSDSDMIMKVKEPVPSEYGLLREGQILYTFLHLASSKKLTQAILKSKAISIAYETIQLKDNSLPLLTPMSEIAGKMSIQAGARFLEKENMGRGILLGGVPGVLPAEVIIIGAGAAGISAARIAFGMGATVTMLDINLNKLRYVDTFFNGRVKTLVSNDYNITKSITKADLIVGAVLIPGSLAPTIITKQMLKSMKKGSVMVDISIDQGGCFETSKATTHKKPTYTVDGIIHFCVTNIPGVIPITSTYALTNATFKYALKIANIGYESAIKENDSIKKGLNTAFGKLTNKAVGKAHNLRYHSPFL